MPIGKTSEEQRPSIVPSRRVPPRRMGRYSSPLPRVGLLAAPMARRSCRHAPPAPFRSRWPVGPPRLRTATVRRWLRRCNGQILWMGSGRQTPRWCRCTPRPEDARPINHRTCHFRLDWLRLGPLAHTVPPGGRGWSRRMPLNGGSERSPGDHTSDGRRWNGSYGLQSLALPTSDATRRLARLFRRNGCCPCGNGRLGSPAPALQRAVFNGIESLVQAERNSVTVDFERVEQLCNPAGQMALQSLAAADASLLSRVRAADSDEARAINVFLGGRILFDRALGLAYADRLLNGRSWSAFMCALRSLCGVTQRALAHLSARFPRYLLDWMAPDAD